MSIVQVFNIAAPLIRLESQSRICFMAKSAVARFVCLPLFIVSASPLVGCSVHPLRVCVVINRVKNEVTLTAHSILIPGIYKETVALDTGPNLLVFGGDYDPDVEIGIRSGSFTSFKSVHFHETRYLTALEEMFNQANEIIAWLNVDNRAEELNQIDVLNKIPKQYFKNLPTTIWDDIFDLLCSRETRGFLN